MDQSTQTEINGLFVSVDLDESCRQKLAQFFDQNLPLTPRVSPNSYHLTLIYSRTPIFLTEILSFSKIEAKILSYEIMMTRRYGKCLILNLDSPQAEELFHLLEKMGGRSDFKEFKPHITLAYNIQDNLEIEELEVPNFELIFDKVKFTPII